MPSCGSLGKSPERTARRTASIALRWAREYAIRWLNTDSFLIPVGASAFGATNGLTFDACYPLMPASQTFQLFFPVHTSTLPPARINARFNLYLVLVLRNVRILGLPGLHLRWRIRHSRQRFVQSVPAS